MRRRRALFLWVLGTVGAIGCSDPSASIVVIVEDPSRAARGADSLRIGSGPDRSAATVMIADELPLTFALTSTSGDRGQVWVSALRGETLLARGSAEVVFSSSAVGEARVALLRVCKQDAECDDGAFCNGPEACRGGRCESGAPPCANAQVLGVAGAYSCVVVTCQEEVDGCSIEPDPRLDDGNRCTRDLCGAAEPVHVIDAALEGQACIAADGGAGACSQGACFSVCGELPRDDGNECTLDLCGIDGVEHRPDPSRDDKQCPLTSSFFASGICRLGSCEPRPFLQVTTPRVDNFAPGPADAPAVDEPGRRVVFRSQAANLVEGDFNQGVDVFQYDRTVDQLSRLPSGSATFEPAPGAPQISPDGNVVAFSSTNFALVPGDDNGLEDVFVLEAGSLDYSRVSISTQGAPARFDEATRSPRTDDPPALSFDGSLVAFSSRGLGLVADDDNGARDVFVRDRGLSTTTLISRDGSSAPGDGDSWAPSISSDGRYLGYLSRAASITGRVGTTEAIFLDRFAGTSRRISFPRGGPDADGQVEQLRVSAQATHVVFSAWGRLLPTDQNDHRDIYLWERSSDQLTLISRNAQGLAGNGGSASPSLTADGGSVLFESSATDLAAASTATSLYLYDRTSDSLRALDVGLALRSPSLSANGEVAVATTILSGTSHLVMVQVVR